MIIGVISDTHDRLPAIDAGIALFQRRNVEAVIHPGDIISPFAAKRLLTWTGPLHITYGNNDGEHHGLKSVLPQIVKGPLFVELGGRRILVHHFIDWCLPADIASADIVITGHTHQVVNRFDGDRLILNPGEACGWVTGRCTLAILDTDGPSAEILDLEIV
ncbi:MAG: metallophosphoesterase [Phycisphaerales bacterium]|nr:metallophosphoesterase [Phycisphaerales bacterium]